MATLPPFGTARKQRPNKFRAIQVKEQRKVIMTASIRAVEKMIRKFKSDIKTGNLSFVGPNNHEIKKIRKRSSRMEKEKLRDKILDKSEIVVDEKSRSVDSYVRKLMREIPNETGVKALSQRDRNKLENMFIGALHFHADNVIETEKILHRKA